MRILDRGATHGYSISCCSVRPVYQVDSQVVPFRSICNRCLEQDSCCHPMGAITVQGPHPTLVSNRYGRDRGLVEPSYQGCIS